MKITAILWLGLLMLLGSGAQAQWRVQTLRANRGEGYVYIEKLAGNGSDNHLLRAVVLDPKRASLRVVDNPEGRQTLGRAMEGAGFVAGVNGGYFHPDFTPLGLVISNGHQIHSKEKAKLITGMVVVNRGRVSLLRVGEYKESALITEALQSGPFLVDQSKPVAGLNAIKKADRTVILSDGKGNTALVNMESVSLSEAAQILSQPGILSEMKVVRALNLDGGSSSALWIKEPAVYIRELKRVRNFLCVVAAG